MKRKEKVITLMSRQKSRRLGVLSRIIFRFIHQLAVNSEAVHTRVLHMTPVRQHPHFYHLKTSRDLLLRNNAHSTRKTNNNQQRR